MDGKMDDNRHTFEGKDDTTTTPKKSVAILSYSDMLQQSPTDVMSSHLFVTIRPKTIRRNGRSTQ
jgi:peptidoglycan biosynthesis protein MviN/MurJ (putative lipid II flippase)